MSLNQLSSAQILSSPTQNPSALTRSTMSAALSGHISILLSQRQLQSRNHLKPKRDLFLLPSKHQKRINFYSICTMRAYAETTSCVHLHSFRRFSRQTQVGGQWQKRLNLRHRKKGDPFISTLNWLEMTSQYLKNDLQMRRVLALLHLPSGDCKGSPAAGAICTRCNKKKRV